MALVLVFLMGIANFAMHRAVLESGHPILGQIAWLYRSLGGRFSLVVELWEPCCSSPVAGSGGPGAMASTPQ